MYAYAAPPSAAEVAPRREASFTKFLHTITDLKESTSQPKEAPPPVIHVEPPQTDSAEGTQITFLTDSC